MVAPLPSSAQPIGTTLDGKPVAVNRVWQRWFNSFTSAAAASAVSSITPSPFSFTANTSGNLLVVGGTVSAITLQRAQTILPTGLTSGFIPMANGDIVTITYSVAPTLNFIPT